MCKVSSLLFIFSLDYVSVGCYNDTSNRSIQIIEGTWKESSLLFIFSLDYVSVGCYKDTSNHAIQIIEGKDFILDGSYKSRRSSIAKCAVAAMRAGYGMFALQNG